MEETTTFTKDELSKPYEDACACGAPSDIGAHGITGGVLYDEYYCLPCYNRKAD